MDISYDKKEHKFLVQYEDGSRIWASYNSVTKMLAKMAGISSPTIDRAPSTEELNEFWDSVPWD